MCGGLFQVSATLDAIIHVSALSQLGAHAHWRVCVNGWCGGWWWCGGVVVVVVAVVVDGGGGASCERVRVGVRM